MPRRLLSVGNCPFVQAPEYAAAAGVGRWSKRLLGCRPMAQTEVAVVASAADPAHIVDREAGLHRNLTPRQLSMSAVGGAIGTGLFLGSALSVKLAGHGVILSYVAAAGIALTLM